LKKLTPLGAGGSKAKTNPTKIAFQPISPRA